ncbi:Cof-type HAD-IIB family hydrolase [Lapidilactobacillus bayanensis]|uniref:Cof-type HAD-IIB family hydrolase n=1 Tax=Lapidilactobacillus bayanensis TaxID=2485998 RepID=UPI0013DE6618|nr:Cof-type HAD-IIB family hydrolase [Lapidilactobacillus bayanensis]
MIKLVAIDLDGTLLNSQHVIAPQNIPVIKKISASGVKVVLASGRPLSGLQSELAALDLTGADQYVVAFNGSLVQSVTGKILSRTSFSFADYLVLEKLAQQYAVNLDIENDQAIYTTSHDISTVVTTESYLLNLPIKIRRVAELPQDLLIPKCMFIDEPDKIDHFLKELPVEMTNRYNFLLSDRGYIDVMPKSATKASGLAKLAAQLKIDASEIMAIGDQKNDLAMLNYVGLPVAMGNGIPEVKSIAKFVTATNDEGGVAQALLKVFGD